MLLERNVSNLNAREGKRVPEGWVLDENVFSNILHDVSILIVKSNFENF